MARASVAQLMAEAGFSLISTGGGCTAYASVPGDGERVIMGGGSVLITDLTDPMAPQCVGDAVAVSIYSGTEYLYPEEAVLIFPNVRAALRALVLS